MPALPLNPGLESQNLTKWFYPNLLLIATESALLLVPRRKAADACPSMETRGRDSGGILHAELRGPKGLIWNIRAAVPRRPVRARIQVSCAV